MDKIVPKITALGVPGLVLFTAVNATGFVGAAALTTALAALGPFGMVGGIATLGLLGLISESITEFGYNAIYTNVVKQLYKQGESRESIIEKVNGYRISKSLKRKILDKLSDLDDM